jgi:hypothetical protein
VLDIIQDKFVLLDEPVMQDGGLSESMRVRISLVWGLQEAGRELMRDLLF